MPLQGVVRLLTYRIILLSQVLSQFDLPYCLHALRVWLGSFGITSLLWNLRHYALASHPWYG